MDKLLIDSLADTTLHRDRDRVHHEVARLVRDHLDLETVAVYQLIDDGGVTRLAPQAYITHTTRDAGFESAADRSSTALADEPAWEDSVRSHRLVHYCRPPQTHCAALPIESDRGVSGLLVVECAKRLKVGDLDFVVGMLRILRNHLALLDYGERDTLTGMLNRKTFETRFAKLQQRLRKADQGTTPDESSWLGLVDIDRFKAINDSHGHLFGDEVLLLVSQLMQKCFRGTDHIFRFGGEEFVILLERATPEGAAAAFERLRGVIQQFQFPQVGRVTISLGYSQVSPNDDPSGCVERADAALYYAKHHGRNNIRNYEALLAAGELAAKLQGEEALLF